MLSFIVPAHDEEALIARAVGAIQFAARAAGAPFEVIVVDDASTDRTAEIAEECGATVVRVNLRQIGAARNAGAMAATGDTLVFVDADTFVAPAHASGVVAAMARGAVGGGAAAQFDEPVPWWAQKTLGVTVRLFRWVKLAAGSFLFCSKSAFEAVGGFDGALYAAEEIALSRALKRLQRGPFVILREPVITSGRKARTHSYRELAWTWGGLLLRPWSVKRRDRLEMWYGPRRHDKKPHNP